MRENDEKEKVFFQWLLSTLQKHKHTVTEEGKILVLVFKLQRVAGCKI